MPCMDLISHMPGAVSTTDEGSFRAPNNKNFMRHIRPMQHWVGSQLETTVRAHPPTWYKHEHVHEGGAHDIRAAASAFSTNISDLTVII